jgi:hypothetical protein
VLCAKKEECRQWQQWAAEAGREKDLVIVNSAGKWRFNFLEWEARRAGEGGGYTINIVALLDEIAGAIGRSTGESQSGGANDKFWKDALHHLNTNLVDLLALTGVEISLPLIRSILNSAPQSLQQPASQVFLPEQRRDERMGGETPWRTLAQCHQQQCRAKRDQ